MMLLLLTGLAWGDATIEAYRDICRERIVNIEDHIQNKKAMLHPEWIGEGGRNHFLFKALDDDAHIVFCGVVLDAFVDLGHKNVPTSFRTKTPVPPLVGKTQLCWTEDHEICANIHEVMLGDSYNEKTSLQRTDPDLLHEWAKNFPLEKGE